MNSVASLPGRLAPTLLGAVFMLSILPANAAAGTVAPFSAPSSSTELALIFTSSPTPAPVALASPAPTDSPAPTPAPSPSPAPTPTPVLAVTMRQQGVSYDPASNKAQVAVTATPANFVTPWQYAFAVRGTVVTSGSSSASSVSVTLTNNCSITTQSVTVSITDPAGHAAGAAGTLDRSLCPPPPNVPHAADRILAGPTLTENSFVDRLRAVSSPALAEGRAIYRTLVAAGVNPAFALGTFHAESHSGTRGYAVTTRNWGNILYYSWEAAYGAVPYAPGNGYTYAKYPTWLASVQAYASLLNRYDAYGYVTVSSASAHWLGTIEGSTRHLTYLNNITSVMSLLPDDAVPSMTSLTVPARSRANVAVSWKATDNLGVTGYQVRTRLGTGVWSAPEGVTQASRVFTLTSGTWTIGVRATDAAANWSRWRYATVVVDAAAPTMVSLATSSRVVRSSNGVFTGTWSARDNVGVTGYQWRFRRNADGTWSSPTSTTARSRDFKLSAGSWYLGVRARDLVGNWSGWREVRVIVPVDDRSYAFSSGTVRRTGSSYYRGTITITNRAGSRLTTTFTGTGFYLVGTSGPWYGRMRVTIDGTAYLVDTGYYKAKRATINRYRVLLFSKSLSAGVHTVTITNLATAHRPTIAIDALGFAR